MNASAIPQLIHIGPFRRESKDVIEHIALPALVISPTPERPVVKGMRHDLKYVTAVIAPQAGQEILYRYNLPGFDSLAQATGLKELYPGVAVTQHKTEDTQLLSELMKEHCQPGAIITHLVLEQSDRALLLLNAWQEENLLENLEALFVRTSPASLYEGMPTQAELIAWCQQNGFDNSFETVSPDISEDPEFILLRFKRSVLHVPLKAAQKKVKGLKQERDNLKKKLTEYEKLIKDNAQQLSEAATALRETDINLKKRIEQCNELDTQLKERIKQHDEKTLQVKSISNEHAKLKQQLSEKETIITQLREQLVSQKQTLDFFERHFEAIETKLGGKLESLLGEQRSYIQQTSNALGQHVSRMSHQQRNEQALINYLKHGQKLLSTELDSGYALALLDQYYSQPYDVVVVFGSGAITELFAQAVMSEQGSLFRLSQGDQLKVGNDRAITSPSKNDLLQTVISIEHQRNSCQILSDRLKTINCFQAVNIVYAPWVETLYQGDMHLFYASETTLQRLSQLLQADAKVLIISSQVLSNSGHSNFILLPQLLRNLPALSLDIIVEGNDDFLRDKELVINWSGVLEKHERNFKFNNFPNALSLSVER